MPEKPEKPDRRDDPAPAPAPAAQPKRYRVLIAGISVAGRAPLYQGAVATVEELGGEERTRKLLSLKRVEEVV